MDIKDFLPLLMKNQGSNSQNASGLLSALSGGDSSKMMETLLAQTMGKDSKNAEMLSLLRLMQSNQKKPREPLGFKPIYPFVAKDILGILVKYFNK